MSVINDKIRVLDSTKIELLEDAKKGDIIDLANLNQVDLNYISSLIEKTKNEEYKRMLANDLEKIEGKHQAEIRELQAKIETEKISLEKELQEKYNSQIQQLEIQKSNLESSKDKDIEIALSQVRGEKDKEIESLKHSLEQVELQYELKKSDEISKLTSQKDEEISKLNLELEKQKGNFATELKDKEIEANNKYSDLVKQYEQLKFEKSRLGVKEIGEGLEQWCDKQYQEQALYGFESCEWIKDNKSVSDDELDSSRTKGDFIFKVYTNEEKKPETLLTSALLDMKDENPDSKNHKKNSDYYDKLNKDRIKKDCEYAILVSTLERSGNTTPPAVIRVSGYEKMYVVQPEYFMVFLSLLASLAKKYSTYLAADKKAILNKQEAIKMFEELRDDILVKSISSLDKSIAEMKKRAEGIKSSADAIVDECTKVQENTLIKLRKKIEKFDLVKATSSLD